eukprot:Skav222472  [mRNA]  locus=scaffold242:37632:46709:+ [translate_table: standard]
MLGSPRFSLGPWDTLQERIGATGVSLGGMASWLLAAADPRVYASAPAIGVQSFHHALVNAPGPLLGDFLSLGFADSTAAVVLEKIWAHRPRLAKISAADALQGQALPVAVPQDLWHARVDSVLPPFETAAAEMGKTKIDQEVVKAVWSRIAPGLAEACWQDLGGGSHTAREHCGQCWPLKLKFEKKSLVSGVLMGKCRRSPMTGEITMEKPTSFPNFQVVDLAGREFLPRSRHTLEEDKYLFKPVPLMYRTWLYQRFFLKPEGFGRGKDMDYIVRQAWLGRAED